jgi:titin
VTSTADSGAGTLRDAITQVNLGKDSEIDFAIGAKGSAQTINLTSGALTPITHAVYINGQSQGGVGNTTPLITVNGAAVDLVGLDLLASGCKVSGLLIEGFYTGIQIVGSNVTIGGTAAGAGNIISGNQGFGLVMGNLSGDPSGVVVQGNYIGTNSAGNAALGNYIGIEVAGSNNTIGGTASGARNVISGNINAGVLLDDQDDQVLGNYIGTNATGNAALANGIGIDDRGVNDTIGGTAAGARNVISGNSQYGILIENIIGNQVLGNFIGTNATGNGVVANADGVWVNGPSNTIGGTVSGAGNLISGNSQYGVFINIGGTGNQVLGNSIGTNAAGNTALANGIGINVADSSNTIGGAASGARNLISGNTQDGVFIGGTGNQVLGNSIGTNAAGNMALANGNGIDVAGVKNTIGGTTSGAGNLISGNSNDGVYIGGSSSGTQVLGNFVGTDATGNAALGNSGNGIEVAGVKNTIGGTASGAGNLISGNSNDGVYIGGSSSGTQVLGNFVGTDATGNAAVGNASGVYVNGSNNTVGGTASGAGNLLSGNSDAGVVINTGSGNQVLGNFIGTNAAGNADLGNNFGILVNHAGLSNTIGGTASGARNLISGNFVNGINILGNGNQVLGNFVGTNSTGNAAVPNGTGIAVAGDGNTIGGIVSGARNFISGNSGYGLYLSGNGNKAMGNFVGTNAAGNAALPNSVGIGAGGANNTIGGTASAARNVISGNSNQGVLIQLVTAGVSGNQVLGNYIGINAAGTAAMANSIGIEDAGTHNTLGGSIQGARNVISGNSGDGILLDSSASGETVQGNFVGLNAAGNATLANDSNGIEVHGNSNTLGGSVAAAGNTIAFNKKGGVLVSEGSQNTIRQNAIFANGSAGKGPGITLSKGANNNLAAPKILSTTLSGTTLTVKGTFTATIAKATYVLEFFANNSGDAEGRSYLGSLTVTPTSTGPQSFTFIATDQVSGEYPVVAATLTDASGNTSVFSNGVSVGSLKSSPPPLPISPPPNSMPPSNSTPVLSPLQMTLEIAIDTAAILLQSNASALLELERFSEMFLGQSLPSSSDLLSAILSDLNLSSSAGLIGLQLGINFADSVKATTP